MNNSEEKNNNSLYLTDEDDNEININPNIFYLYNNFLIKENKNYFSNHKFSSLKEIMPEYSDINLQIQKKINNVRGFYTYDPIFRDMLSKNSYAVNLFIRGFREMFFGPKGIVTRKSQELKKYYKSFEPKVNLETKINVGSLDYYDFLSKYNSFFERLKNSRKKILKISGNFEVVENGADRLHAKFAEYEEKRRKKNALIKKKVKINNSNYFNKLNNKTIEKNIKKKKQIIIFIIHSQKSKIYLVTILNLMKD